jgi:hypothetical protein
MSQEDNIMNRRDFLKGATYAGVAAAIGLPLELSWADEQTKKTRVVLIRDAGVINEKGKIDAGIVQRMLDQAVARLFDKDEPMDAWERLINPDDVVGIKSNEWAYLPTPPEVEQAIKKRVLDAGIPEKFIDIDDRGVLYNDTFLMATALINVRPLRIHHWSGIGGCIKNYIMFVSQPSRYHGDSCADLATIWKQPLVKDKTRLNILVVLTPQFYGVGAHHFDTTYVWQYKGLLVGTDPVAVDAVGVRLLEAKRKVFFDKDKPILPPPHHVAYADIRHNLGISDQSKIELVKLGWQDEALI